MLELSGHKLLKLSVVLCPYSQLRRLVERCVANKDWVSGEGEECNHDDAHHWGDVCVCVCVCVCAVASAGHMLGECGWWNP